MKTGPDSGVEQWIVPALTIFLILVALVLWYRSPIYPDEIAYRIARMRFIPDHGVMRGLFAVCDPTGFEPASWSKPVAWGLSWLDSHLSAYQLRSLPIGATVAVACSLGYYVQRSGQNYLLPVILIGFIGVAASGLVITRFEHIVSFSIAVNIYVLSAMTSPSISVLKSVAYAGLLLLAASASVFVHPQGLLFLPLSAFVILRLVIVLKEIRPLGVVAAGLIGIFSLMIMAVFVASVYSDFGYCKSSEAMLNELNRLKIQSIPVNFEDFFNFLSVKVSNFSNSFLYKSEYQVNYLPGVLDLNNKNQLFAMNAVVRLYVIGLLAFVSIATLVRVVTVLRNCFRGNVFTALSASQSSIAAALICVPGIILIVYDNQQYFYRSIFINLAFSLSAVLYLADMPKIKAPMAKWLIFLGFAFPLVLSVYFNYKLFYYRLPDWSAIYSMPGKAIEGGSLEDISKLAEQCNISLPEGGFVVDSATYDHLKQYRNLQLIWYIEYQSTVTGLTIPEILKLSNSRNVIASCSAIERSEVGFPYLQRRGNLCCYRYTNDPDAR